MSKKRHYRPKAETSEATRRYIQWMRLTHNGRRTPLSPACNECGDVMTAKDIAEYRQRFVPGVSAAGEGKKPPAAH